MNQVVFVGRLVSDPEIKELESGKKTTNITVGVNRTYKNSEGVYETDFIDCILWDAIATNTTEYCKKGDIVGIKGRLQTTNVDDGDGHMTRKVLQVVAERVTFLSSRNTNIDNINA